MKKISAFALILASCFLLAACSGGPSSSDVESALEDKMKSEAQNQLAAMAQIGNTELAKEMGLPAPEDIEISDFDMENLTKKENGYWEAKVVFVSEQKGKQDRKVAARVLLIETEGQWRVARMARL